MDVLVARKKRDTEIEHGPARRPDVLTEMEDAVAYLVVLGAGGSWGYGHDTGERVTDRWGIEKRVCEQRDFKSGVHHVDAETVAFARRQRNDMIHVFPEMPMVTIAHRDAPLSKGHLRLPADGAVMLASPEVEEAEDGTSVVPLDVVTAYPCDYCDIVPFVHPGAHALHTAIHHAEEVRREVDSQPDPPPPPEPALTDA